LTIRKSLYISKEFLYMQANKGCTCLVFFSLSEPNPKANIETIVSSRGKHRKKPYHKASNLEVPQNFQINKLLVPFITTLGDKQYYTLILTTYSIFDFSFFFFFKCTHFLFSTFYTLHYCQITLGFTIILDTIYLPFSPT
jgi:hypothetical protein